MKKEFVIPEIKFINISAVDIITTSYVWNGGIGLPIDPFSDEDAIT